jgi:hypothetical protein
MEEGALGNLMPEPEETERRLNPVVLPDTDNSESKCDEK